MSRRRPSTSALFGASRQANPCAIVNAMNAGDSMIEFRRRRGQTVAILSGAAYQAGNADPWAWVEIVGDEVFVTDGAREYTTAAAPWRDKIKGACE